MRRMEKAGLGLSLFLGLTMSIGAGEIFEPGSRSVQDERKASFRAIAPDGSYILFDIKGGSYLFVCFRQNDGTWGEAIDLTKHGLNPKAGGAYISPDGKYLFVHLGQGYHWVSTALIEDLRPGRGKLS